MDLTIELERDCETCDGSGKADSPEYQAWEKEYADAVRRGSPRPMMPAGLSPDDHVVELAVAFTRWPDPSLTLIDAGEWLVIPPEDCFEAGPSGLRWTARCRPAARVHQIEAKAAYDGAGVPDYKPVLAAGEVAIALCDLVAHVKRREKARRVILISDNAVFETHHIRQVLKAGGEAWPFHYCTWDSSLFLEALGVGDPKDPPHRAMGDVFGLMEACREALSRVEMLRKLIDLETGEPVPQETPRFAVVKDDAP